MIATYKPTNDDTLSRAFSIHLLISFSHILFLHLDLTKCKKSTIYCDVHL
jgi:hypothetical protein